jgi:hypothetical protein
MNHLVLNNLRVIQWRAGLLAGTFEKVSKLSQVFSLQRQRKSLRSEMYWPSLTSAKRTIS